MITYKIEFKGKWTTAKGGIELDSAVRELIEAGANPQEINVSVI